MPYVAFGDPELTGSIVGFRLLGMLLHRIQPPSEAPDGKNEWANWERSVIPPGILTSVALQDYGYLLTLMPLGAPFCWPEFLDTAGKDGGPQEGFELR